VQQERENAFIIFHSTYYLSASAPWMTHALTLQAFKLPISPH
jgi:hypothetical protein